MSPFTCGRAAGSGAGGGRVGGGQGMGGKGMPPRSSKYIPRGAAMRKMPRSGDEDVTRNSVRRELAQDALAMLQCTPLRLRREPDRMSTRFRGQCAGRLAAVATTNNCDDDVERRR
eukprot:919982-Pyramimonas_sp.AAC.1